MPAPNLCTVSGTIYGPGGTALQGVIVKATVETAFVDAYGNYIASGVYASTTTDSNGDWSLAVVRTQSLNESLTFQFIYPTNNNQSNIISYPAVIPEQSTADFSDLVDINSSNATLTAVTTTDSLTEGSVNLYFTNARARSSISAGTGISYDSSTGVVTCTVSAISSATAPLQYSSGVISITQSSGSTNGYLSSTDWTTFNSKQAALGYTAENQANKGAANGYAPLDGSSKVSTTYLPAAVLGSVNYQGTWDASLNSPSLASGVGTKGYYYVVSVAGSTNLDGVSSWAANDWAIFNGTAWEKIDNTDAVTSVDGMTGAVTLTKGNLTESTSSVLTITGGSSAVWGSGASIQVKQASSGQSGYLSSTDWSTFNNKQAAVSSSGAMSTLLDNISSTQGTILYRGASSWSALSPGTSGQYLQTQGAAANPQWATVSAGSTSVVSKTTTYTATTSDDVILVDTSGGAWTLSLYTAVGNSGKKLIIKKTNSEALALTIDPNGSETIDGSSTRKMWTLNESYTIVSDGSNWKVLDHKTDTTPTSYSLTIGATTTPPTKGTTSADNAQWWREGKFINITYQFEQTATGSSGSGTYLFPIPNTSVWSVPNTLFTASTDALFPVGQGKLTTSSGNTSASYSVQCYPADSTNIFLAFTDNVSSGVYTNVGSSSFALGSGATRKYYYWAKLPISEWDE